MQRHKSLSLLSSDHHHGLRMAKLLKQAENPAGVYAEAEAFYNSMLSEHFEEEEKYLAPFLPDNHLIKRMLGEHKKMKKMFGDLAKSANLKQDLILLGNFLENHIRFEERELFPMIESTLSEDTLHDIGLQIEADRRS